METLEKKGKGSALLPFLLFIVIYLGAGLYFQAQGVEMAFYQFPSVTAMFIALLLAFCQGKGTIDQKFTIFAKGAANENVLTMLMIYILAGAFSTVASAMGGVDATVNMGLSIIPVHFLAAGVFVISAFMGTATGTSMGTISAIVPIAVQPLHDLRYHHRRHPHPGLRAAGQVQGELLDRAPRRPHHHRGAADCRQAGIGG